MRESIQPVDELVIELHEYLSPADARMVQHMVRWSNVRETWNARWERETFHYLVAV
jgi:hypothetical protein